MNRILRNALSLLFLGTMLGLAISFPPESSVKEAYLICPDAAAKIFSDMLACAMELKKQVGCSCSRPPSRTSLTYWVLLPIALGFASAFLFRAKVIWGIAMLIACFLLFGSSTLLLLGSLGKLDAEGVFFSILYLVPLAGISVVSYGLVLMILRYVWKSQNAT
jgi:hypothetical protein